MTDPQLVEGFERGTLAAVDFRHRDHVRLTWIYLTHFDRTEAERRLLEGLRAFASRAGRPDKFDAALTRAWVTAIDEARLAFPDRAFDELVSARPDLLQRGSVRVSATT
jgi:hypothetical protein